VYLSVDDYQRNAVDFEPVKEYLQRNGFRYNIKEWEQNVGCDTNVIEGIHWFFSHTDHGIILEDDCVPTAAIGTFAKEIYNGKTSRNISLFATPVNKHPESWQPSFLPIYWGWYTNRAFFSGFYSFYHQQKIGIANIRAVLSRPLSTRIKLIAVLNYYAHRSRRKGIAWDSVLFFYLLQQNETFLVPAVSMIRNEGFGNSMAHTHTSAAPGWYKDVVVNEVAVTGHITVNTYDAAADNRFLEIFFGNYSAPAIKLVTSILKSVFASNLKGSNQ
jgi:hypothetical protein